MPLAKSAPEVKVAEIQSTAVVSNPENSFSRLDIGGVGVDIFNYFDVPMSASEKVVGKLKIISDWASDAGSMGDALLKIRSLETHLGSPSGTDKRYDKLYQYCKMDLYSKELEKRKESLRRRF